MSKDILVSICIPIYNPTSFLKETLISILQQSHNNFEIILSIENNSSSIYVNELIDILNDKRISLITNNTNSGIFYNLNNAIRHSKGFFIQIFCQDDLMHKNLIKNNLSLISSDDNLLMVFSESQNIDSKNNLIPMHISHNDKVHWPNKIFSQRAINYLLVYGCFPGNLSPVMLSRKSIETIGYFNPDMPYVGDFEYWMRVATQGNIGFNKKVNVYIRNHDKQASQTLDSRLKILDSINIINQLYLQKNINLKDWKIKGYLNQYIGSQFFHSLIYSAITKKDFSYIRVLPKLNKTPFSLFWIIILYLTSFRNTFNFYKIDKSKL